MSFCIYSVLSLILGVNQLKLVEMLTLRLATDCSLAVSNGDTDQLVLPSTYALAVFRCARKLKQIDPILLRNKDSSNGYAEPYRSGGGATPDYIEFGRVTRRQVLYGTRISPDR